MHYQSLNIRTYVVGQFHIELRGGFKRSYVLLHGGERQLLLGSRLWAGSGGKRGSTGHFGWRR